MSFFVGKVAVVGAGGAGKTRMLNTIVNILTNNKFPWDEEANLAGTLVVTPYSVIFPLPNVQPVKVIFADNPGQNSLETMRLSSAKAGSGYKAIIIVLDSTAWNFRSIGILHAESLARYINGEKINIAIISSKSDLSELLTNMYNTIIAQTLEKAIENITPYMPVPYYNRTIRERDSFRLTINDDWIPFTQLEQYFVNALEHELKNAAFTPMNIRLLVRSLLLGYCNYYTEHYPDFLKHAAFNAIDDQLVNSLNYYRPTSYETQTPWRVLAAQSILGITGKNEIPFHRSAFKSSNILFVLQNYVIGQYSNHIEFIEQIKESHPNWEIIDNTYTNITNREGLENTRSSFEHLLMHLMMETNKNSKKSTIDDLGLSHFS